MTSWRLTLFGGKGGVGKTTCAAAAAVRAAREGARVLVVSTDPAHSLADALDARIGKDPTAIAPRLFAAQLDADRALGRWLGDRESAFRTIAERGTYLDEEDVDRLLSLSLPGVDELVGLVELVRLARTRPFDEVVVDTAPTGHTLRLLEMPETLRRLAEVLDDMHAKHRFLASSLGGAWRPDFADDVIADVEREAMDLRALLRDGARTSFTWVTLAEELPIDESLDGVRALEALGVRVRAVVVNRVWPEPPDGACARCTPRVRAERACLARIERELASVPRLAVPAQPREPRGVEALARVAGAVRVLDAGTGTGTGTGGRGVRRSRSRGRGRAEREADRAIVQGGERSVGHARPLGGGAALVFFGGKGGVGKTTAASAEALAIAARAPHARVLVLSTDPAPSLGDALGVAIGDRARSVPGAPPRLRAREIDARAAFDREKAKYHEAIEELFASMFGGRVDVAYDRAVLEDLLDLAPPGLDELFAVVSIVEALDAAWDTIVVDTAPTGHTIRLLELPARALEWVHAIMTIILKYRRIVGLGQLAQDLTTLARRLRGLLAILSDPKRCAFVVVTRAAELPRLETARLVTALGELRVPLAAVLVNAVTDTPSCSTCASVALAEAPELRRLRAIADRARARAVVAPALYPPPRGPRALAAWRKTWL